MSLNRIKGTVVFKPFLLLKQLIINNLTNNIMKEQFVTYQIAQKLKELGFNKACFGYFSNIDNTLRQGHYGSPINETITIAPLYQQAIDWLRNEHNFIVAISPHYFDDENMHYKFNISKRHNGIWEGGGFKYYSEARQAAILKALELIG